MLVFYYFTALLFSYWPILEIRTLLHLLQMSPAKVNIAKALCCLSFCLVCLLIIISAISTCCLLFWLTFQGRSVTALHVLMYLTTVHSAEAWIWQHTYYKSLGLGHNCWGHTLVKWSLESFGILLRQWRWKNLRYLFRFVYDAHVSLPWTQATELLYMTTGNYNLLLPTFMRSSKHSLLTFKVNIKYKIVRCLQKLELKSYFFKVDVIIHCAQCWKWHESLIKPQKTV